jgi:two-component system, LytTR family, sensor histidine kinase AlgZ
MKDSRILSVFQELPLRAAGKDRPAALLDACSLGVALRAVLLVQTVLGVAALFGSSNWLDWLSRFSLFTAGGFPATLCWLIIACLLKRWLGHLNMQGQMLAGVLLGAVSGLYGCALLAFTGWFEQAAWLASAFTGALLSAALLGTLALRERGKTPATTAARLSELQSRIRPHFLFNTLNSAIALVRAEPAKAEGLLEDLSELFRHALADPGESVTLEDEMILAKRYLSIEQVRFGERLKVEWSLDAAASQARLPPLLLQPLVENAVRHGVEPSAGGAQIRISTQHRGASVVIKVTNTSPGGPGEPGAGMALQNVRDRLSLMHDVQGQFQSGFSHGVFQVRIEVPA